MSLSTLAVGWVSVVGQVDAGSASLLRRVSRLAVLIYLKVPWRLIQQGRLLVSLVI